MSKRKKKNGSEKQKTYADAADIPMASVAHMMRNPFESVSVRNAVPESWREQACKAWTYYREEPIVSNAINAWRTFAIGDEIQLTSDNAEMQEAARAFYRDLKLNEWIKNMIFQLLVKGDAVGYIAIERSGEDIERLICVNPISIEFQLDGDTVVGAVQRARDNNGRMSGPKSLSLNNLRHWKWNSPEYDVRGTSMVLPAFESIELLRDYRKAERAIAKRWAAPLRFIQVGGNFGGKIIAPTDKMIEDIRNEMNHMDAESGLVVPFYVKAETYGVEGKALNTEDKVKEVKEDILVALGMARSIVTGDGPNFATATVSMQKMQVMVKDIKQHARDMLNWVFDEWKAYHDFEDYTLHYQFNDLDLTAEVDQKKVLLDMYDRGLISKSSLQQKMGLSPEVEDKRMNGDTAVMDANWSAEDITKLVAMEVLTVDEARRKLGLEKPADEAHEASAMRDAERLYARCNEKMDLNRH